MLTDHELSAMVAEKVMGDSLCVPYGSPSDPSEHGPCDGFGPNGSCSMCTGLIERDFGERFATDQGFALDAALKVAHEVHIEEWGEQFMATAFGDNCTAGGIGTTVARALCLASLRAVGVEVEDDGGGE